MLTKAEKKNIIRQDILDAAIVYSQNLAGRSFLYVYGEEYFELYFPTNRFLHLTGVATYLSGKEFYKNAKNATLTCDQFFFNSEHPYNSARKKLPCLKRAPELTNTIVCVLKDMQTLSITYKLSVTNLEFTLGLVQQTDNNGNAMPNRFIPMTLRVEDSSVNKSGGGEVIDFIFSKDASKAIYDTLTIKDERKEIPESVRMLITKELCESEVSNQE